MFSGLLERIRFDSKRDWLSWIANLFLLTCISLTGPGLYGQAPDSGRAGVIDTLQTSHFMRWSPLLDSIKPATAKVKDSILPAYLVLLDSSLRNSGDSAETQLHLEPFFAPHAMKVKALRLQVKPWTGNELPFVVLVFGFIFLAMAQYYYGKRLVQIIRACINSRFLAQLIRNGDLYNEQISTYLFLIYILTLPLLILEINSHYLGYAVPGGVMGLFSAYLLILGAFAVLYGIKILAIRFSGTLFKTYAATQEYILVIFVFNLVEGLLMLLFLTAIIFTSSELVLQLCLLVLALVYAYRLFRAFFLGLGESKYSIFYLFLFFGTIEVLPLVILVRLMMNFFPA